MKRTTGTIPWILLVAIVLVLAVGVYVALTQTRPTITKTAQATLTVKPKPTFTLTLSPDHIDTYVGRADAAYGATVTSVNGFAGEVVFTVSGLPAGFTVTFFPADRFTLGAGETKSVQMNIAVADDDALAGDYTITVTAESTNYN